MIAPEVSEKERTATRVDPAANGEQTRTRTTATVMGVGSRLQSAVWLVVGIVIVDVIQALDFVLKLLAAANVGFVGFITSVAGLLSAPFRGVLASSVPSGHYFYWPDVVAVVVYVIAA
jgi:predicted tellurium resistance membrane protein TerC